MDNTYTETCPHCFEDNTFYTEKLFDYDACRCWHCSKLWSINENVQLEKSRVIDGEEI